jgi:hypothetical protein
MSVDDVARWITLTGLWGFGLWAAWHSLAPERWELALEVRRATCHVLGHRSVWSTAYGHRGAWICVRCGHGVER